MSNASIPGSPNSSFTYTVQTYNQLQTHRAPPAAGSITSSNGGNVDNDGSVSIEQFLAALREGGGDSDVIVALLTKQIMEADQQIKDRLAKFDRIAKFRGAINKRIANLQKLKQFLENEGDKDGEMSHSEINQAIREEKIADFDYNTYEYKLDELTGEVTEEVSGHMGKDDFGSGDYRINTEHISEEIQRHQGTLSELSSNDQVEMIRLNAIINKKAQAAQLASNLIKKDDSTESAIINNLR